MVDLWLPLHFFSLDEKKRSKEKSRQNNASAYKAAHPRYSVGPTRSQDEGHVNLNSCYINKQITANADLLHSFFVILSPRSGEESHLTLV